MTRRPPHLLALFLFVAASCDVGGVTIRVVPAEGVDLSSPEIASLWLTATEERAGERRERTSTAASLTELRVKDLEPGWWSFRVEGFDRDGGLRLRGETVPVRVARGEHVTISLVLAPPETIVPLPVQAGREANEEIAETYGLSATSLIDHEGREVVLVAGGGDREGRAGRSAWLYRPDLLAFEAVEPLSCPRAGHSATAVELSEGRQVVLLAGGAPGSDNAVPCEGGAGRTLANSMEIFDPETRAFRFFDPQWDFAPDLSRAVVAPIATGKAILQAKTQVWLLDLERPADSRQIATLESPWENRRAISLSGGTHVALVGAQRNKTSIMVFNEQERCAERTLDPTFSAGTSVTALPNDQILALDGDQWWVVITSGCYVVSSEMFRGIHGPRRYDHRVTKLADGRFLAVGGTEGEGSRTSLFVPSSWDGAEAPERRPARKREAHCLRPGPETEHGGGGHAVAGLPDGTALIVGGGARTELYNPWEDRQEIVEIFDGGEAVEAGNRSRVVMVVDGTESGQRLRSLVSGVATNMLPRPAGGEFDPAPWSAIGVISTDRGAVQFSGEAWCDDHPPDWAWSRCWSNDQLTPDEASSWIEGGDPRLEALLPCRIVDAGWEDDGQRCRVRQPLAVVSGFLDQLEAGEGELVGGLDGELDSLLFVLAVAGEDCSEAPEAEARDLEFNSNTCHPEAELIDPEALAGRIADLTRERIRVEVVVLFGSELEEFCSLSPRLEWFVEALGDQGYAFSACNAEEADESSGLIQNVARSLTYRTACLEPGATSPPETCQVYVRWEDDAEIWSAPRELGEAWSFEPDWAPECAPYPGAVGDALRLSRTCPGAPEGRFQSFLYHCW